MHLRLELSNFSEECSWIKNSCRLVINRMNLHEQCLLRYLQNPQELSYSTEILKVNNFILEKQFILKNISNSDIIKTVDIHQ